MTLERDTESNIREQHQRVNGADINYAYFFADDADADFFLQNCFI